MANLHSLLPMLLCPQCHRGKLSVENKEPAELLCDCCNAHYPVSFDRPVLLRADNVLFCLDDYHNLKSFEVRKPRSFTWKNLIPSPSVNLASPRVLENVRQSLAELPIAKVLVVGGGNQRQWLDNRIGVGERILAIYSDIDVRADVDLFCDGHDLPFESSSFDAVITTAVLEHVLYPERVASEITRVLKLGGLIYSELPFMQQVHEGAYDFTRYTLSGHRRLFNSFAEIESGLVAGPGTALVWAIENFVLAFIVRPALRKVIKALIRLGLFWLKYFDYLMANRPEAMDGASCTYFLGRKVDVKVADSDIITRYVGAKHLSHT